jgi:hypothetical protein
MTDESWTIRLRPDGTVETLWHDALDLEDLGSCQVQRLTDVEHNGQGWCLRWSATQAPMTDNTYPKRADALAAERRLIWTLMQQGHPL